MGLCILMSLRKKPKQEGEEENDPCVSTCSKIDINLCVNMCTYV